MISRKRQRQTRNSIKLALAPLLLEREALILIHLSAVLEHQRGVQPPILG
jgi:hypothetical protein